MAWKDIFGWVPMFCFGYPFIMAWYWMAGGLLHGWLIERHGPAHDIPPKLDAYPPVSILVPCHNEGPHVEEVITTLAAVAYPNFEIIAINDGSRDNTGELLDGLTKRIPQLRVVHLMSNQGKSVAMNCGAMVSRYEIIIAIDGDSFLDKHAVTWLVRRFLADSTLGALTGNPRIRNRSSVLAKLQVGEYSAIIGLIKRAQTLFGWVFTVSGVICAFRKKALRDAGWWSPNTLTDDVQVTWNLQLAGWTVAFEPHALCWILMPETLRGLWVQRLRWSEGGTQTTFMATRQMLRWRNWRSWPVWVNYVLGIFWSYVVLSAIGIWLLSWIVWIVWPTSGMGHPGFSLLPAWWGAILTVTYLLQTGISLILDRRYQGSFLGALFWQIWYPVFFWMMQALTSVVGLPKAIARINNPRGTWVSPDRGIV
jgi:poly-beta-1,6-N-acetyl-D-glucosamine synthase